jgi:hypothetical protein
MQDERAAEVAQAAIREAMQILSDARRPFPPQVAAPLPRFAKPRTVRIGGAEFELDKLAFVVLLFLVGMYSVIALAYVRAQSLAESEDQALTLLTTPDASPVHLVAQGGFAAGVQGAYWPESDTDVAVLALSDLPPVSGGIRYQWSARHGDHWIALGRGTVNGEDHVHLIATSPELSTPPDAIRVTLEVADAEPTIVGRTVLSWSNH